MFCGLFFRFNSFPFLNHLNLREEYSEMVSHRSTSLEPAADSWLFISFNRRGKAEKRKKKRSDNLVIFWREVSLLGESDQDTIPKDFTIWERDRNGVGGTPAKMYLNLKIKMPKQNIPWGGG